MKAEWTNKDSLTPSETTGETTEAILVVDMPRSCAECKLKYLDTGDDAYWGTNVERCIWDNCEIEQNERAYDCPLKPLPDCPDVPETISNDVAYILGWNDCIAEILKNEKKQNR